MTSFRSKIGFWLGSIAGWWLMLFAKSPKLGEDDLKRVDFKTSTQRIGVRFTEKIRTFFRHKWLKKY